MPMPRAETPFLRGVLYRVSDVDAAAAFFRNVLGAPIGPGPRQGWQAVDVGGGQALWLAPGGRPLPPLHDRWEQRGIIPILKTMAVDDERRNLDQHHVEWINEPFDYDMKGHARLGYFMGPDNQPVGIQQRMADTQREEDLATLAMLRDLPAMPRWLGIGWLIYQAEDIVGVRDFIQQAFEWPQLRGTEGFGYMLQIAPTVTLQIAFKGQREDPGQDLQGVPILPVLQVANADTLRRRVETYGGTVRDGFDAFDAVADPEGHTWLVAA
jgi:predicted enzyme related to lactoylglutathione lyase